MAGYCGACLDMHRECDIAPFEADCKLLELCLACEDELSISERLWSLFYNDTTAPIL